MIDPDREKFEKWAGPAGYDLETDEGNYADPETDSAFVGFSIRQSEIDALKAEIASANKKLDGREKRQDLLDRINKDLLSQIDALKAEAEKLRNENVDLSVRVDALNDLMGYKEDDTFANTTENRKLIRELWEEPK